MSAQQAEVGPQETPTPEARLRAADETNTRTPASTSDADATTTANERNPNTIPYEADRFASGVAIGVLDNV